ncbi:unnamed protein product [Moneuplotes crassus]|uniref:Uncharacterized protein n=1 Tax=Euplotes crassus TaxID=5936 RepID=A0AAD1XYT5_EUPCR|nr:unnamed protein product [Moneuplotes crassus]
MTNPPKEAILPIPETDDLQEHESSAMQSMARVQEDEKVGHDNPKEELTEDGTGQRHGAFEAGIVMAKLLWRSRGLRIRTMEICVILISGEFYF